MKDELKEIEERYKRLHINKPLQSGETIIDPLQVQIDIQNLLKLVKVYENEIIDSDIRDGKWTINTIRKQIFNPQEKE